MYYSLVRFCRNLPAQNSSTGHIIPDDTPGVSICGLKATKSLGWVDAEELGCNYCRIVAEIKHLILKRNTKTIFEAKIPIQNKIDKLFAEFNALPEVIKADEKSNIRRGIW